MKKGISTIVEITDTHVKLFQSKMVRGRRVICACDIKTIHNQTNEEITRLLRECTVTKTISSDDLILSIPRRLIIVKSLRLPSQNETEIKKMVGLQLVDKIPYALEDVIFDSLLIEKDPSGYSQVLAIVVHKEVCQKYLKMFNRVGLNIQKMTLSSLGILAWLNHQENKKAIDSRQPVLVVNIDQSQSEICIYYNRKILFSRQIIYGAKDIDAENIIELIEQIKLSLEAYHKDDLGPEIKKSIIVSTLNSQLIPKERIEKETKIPLELMVSLDNILCQRSINLTSLKDQVGINLTSGIGLLMTDPKKLINLAPPEIHDVKTTKLRKSQWVRFYLLLFFICFTGASILGLKVYRKNVQLTKLQQKLSDTKKQIKKAEKRIQFVKFLNQEFNERVFIPDIIVELYNLIKEDIYFRSISINEKKSLTIQGYAETSSGVNNLQSSLVQSPMFKNVTLQFATKRKIFRLDVTDFKISCDLNIVGERDDD